MRISFSASSTCSSMATLAVVATSQKRVLDGPQNVGVMDTVTEDENNRQYRLSTVVILLIRVL